MPPRIRVSSVEDTLGVRLESRSRPFKHPNLLLPQISNSARPRSGKLWSMFLQRRPTLVYVGSKVCGIEARFMSGKADSAESSSAK